MRGDFLPYEKAIEAMAREYAKIKLINVLDDKKAVKKPDKDRFYMLENTYCMNIEMLILLRQLKMRSRRPELVEQIDQLIAVKNNNAMSLEKAYKKTKPSHIDSPAVSRLVTPEILRRLLFIETYIVNNAKSLSEEYPELIDLEKEEIKASIILDNIILIITSL
ncbi:MAG: hypothetical protein ACOX3U_05725 [Christensenellales bacterium]|jgi:hypothetical protein